MVTHLYPKQMSLYGDRGNILVLQKRALEIFNLNLRVQNCLLGQKIDPQTKLIMLGGGQDYDQNKIIDHLLAHSNELKSLIQNGAFYLGICGGYQLLGEFYQTASGQKIQGLNLLNLWTVSPLEGESRIIGNLEAYSSQFGLLLGFENHGGHTFLGSKLQPLAQVKKGGGNNGQDGSEGVWQKYGKGWIMGTYLHGFLPKNYQVADFILQTISGFPPSKTSSSLLENLNRLERL